MAGWWRRGPGLQLLQMLVIYHFQTLVGVDCLREMRVRIPNVVRAFTAVRLLCEYDLESAALYSMKWYRDDQEFYRYVPKEEPPARAFTVDPPIEVDILDSDSHGVRMSNISPSLSGTYKCEVTADAPLFHTDIKSAHMLVVEVVTSETVPQVTAAGPAPAVGVLGSGLLAAPAEQRLTCRGPPASIRPNITWYINDKMVKQTDGDVVQRPLDAEVTDGGLLVARAELRMRPLLGAVLVRCDVTLYDVYTASAEHRVRAPAPPPAPMMGPTAPLGLSDFTESAVMSSSSAMKATGIVYVVFVWLV